MKFFALTETPATSSTRIILKTKNNFLNFADSEKEDQLHSLNSFEVTSIKKCA